jgi:hypothetical protein
MHAYVLLKTPTEPLVLPEGTIGCLQLVGNEWLSVVVEPDLSLAALQQDDALLLQAVLAHDRIIRALFCQTTVLPLRFTSFSPIDSLLADLHQHHQRYLEILNQIEGKAEYTITLTPIQQPETPISPNLTGKAYFLARKQQVQAQHAERQQQREELQMILAVVADCYPYRIATVPETESQRIHILLPKVEEDTLWQVASAFNEKFPRWQIDLGEALPPYHFVDSDS